jgi:hypothetical protein
MRLIHDGWSRGDDFVADGRHIASADVGVGIFCAAEGRLSPETGMSCDRHVRVNQPSTPLSSCCAIGSCRW